MPATQIFFTSYARLDNLDGKLASTIEAIKNRVSAKTGEAATIFFDTTELKNGIEWQDRLGCALKETRVVVCLCSPAYLKSAFCAKEFEVFRLRVDSGTQDAVVAIIPVIWEATPLPEVIRRFHQPKDPRFPSDYYVAGLYKLASLKSQADSFISAIEAVADDVDAADRQSKLQPYQGAVVYDNLPNFFHNPKAERYGVRVTVLHDKRSQWKPGTVRSNVGALVDAVTDSLRIAWEDVPPDPVTLTRSLAEAEKSRLVSIFVIDGDDADKAPWQNVLSAIDKSGRENVALLVGWKVTQMTSPSDIKEALRRLAPSGMLVDYFPLDDEHAFKETLKRVITTVRMALINRDEASRVVSPEVRNEAVSNGIPVDSLSTLSSPGAGS